MKNFFREACRKMDVLDQLAALLFMIFFIILVMGIFKGTLKRSKHTKIFAIVQKRVCT